MRWSSRRSACCLALLGYASVGYGVVAAGLGAGFVWYAWKVLRMADGDREMRPAKALFAYSLLYLFAHLRRLSGRCRRRARARRCRELTTMELETVKPTEAS